MRIEVRECESATLPNKRDDESAKLAGKGMRIGTMQVTRVGIRRRLL